MRGELSMAPFSRSGKRTAESAWGSISELTGDPNFVAVCAFSAIGLLISLCLAMQFPDTAAAMVALLVQL
jgi:hypothetical protein